MPSIDSEFASLKLAVADTVSNGIGNLPARMAATVIVISRALVSYQFRRLVPN
jgi:hypothetical protein